MDQKTGAVVIAVAIVVLILGGLACLLGFHKMKFKNTTYDNDTGELWSLAGYHYHCSRSGCTASKTRYQGQ
jgi:hypothetical protein